MTARSRSVALAVAWRSIHNVFTNPALIVPSPQPDRTPAALTLATSTSR